MRRFALVLSLATACAAACGGGDESAGETPNPDASADASSQEASDGPPDDTGADADAPNADAGDSGPTDAADADVGPPCDQEPCAARPIIFVHGFQGSWDDFVAMMVGLVVYDGRWDSFTVSGNDDALGWKPNSFSRRRWLFGFDYYLKKAADGRGSYTAGPGRIGSNVGFNCPAPAGSGHILGDNPEYDQDYTHEYAGDLAKFVERVLAATGAKRVDLVGHSMGGMIVRSYLSSYGGSAVTERTMLLASPVRGVGLIGFLQLFPVTGPSWQALHEIAELDSGSVVSKVRFLRCGDAATDKGAFGQKLLDMEQGGALPTELYVMSGGSDLSVAYDVADHPLEQWHEVVDGASHSGILSSEITRKRVAEILGGTF